MSMGTQTQGFRRWGAELRDPSRAAAAKKADPKEL